MTSYKSSESLAPANNQFRSADLENREYLKELGMATRAFFRVVRDTDSQPDLFTVFRTFPVFDIMKFTTSRLPILKDPTFMSFCAQTKLPDLTSEGIRGMLTLPEGTLGRSFSEFVNAKGLSDDHLTYLLPPDNPLRYIIYRTAMLHDLLHFLTRFTSDNVFGEIEVDAYQLAQTGLINHHLFIAGGVMNVALKTPTRLGEAYRRGRAAYNYGAQTSNLFLTDWAPLWELNQGEVRQRLGLAPLQLSAGS